MSREQFEQLRSPRGALAVGSPQEVIEKGLQHELFGHQRFQAQLSVGPMPHDKVMRAIELLGTEVAPVVPQGDRTPHRHEPTSRTLGQTRTWGRVTDTSR